MQHSQGLSLCIFSMQYGVLSKIFLVSSVQRVTCSSEEAKKLMDALNAASLVHRGPYSEHSRLSISEAHIVIFFGDPVPGYHPWGA